jgi:hypothetical protein
MRRHGGRGHCKNCYNRKFLKPRQSGQSFEWYRVELAIAHGANTLTPAERTAAVDALTSRGWSGSRIAAHLGVTQRTVCRIRARIRDDAVCPPRRTA